MNFQRCLPIVAMVLLMLSAIAVRADSISFNISGAYSGSGTFTGTLLSGTTYQLTGVSGTLNGVALVGLSSALGADNILNLLQPFVSFGGITLVGANSVDYNIYYSGSRYAITLDGNGDDGATIALDVAAVPEPSGVLLFGSGILGLAGVLRRKRAA